MVGMDTETHTAKYDVKRGGPCLKRCQLAQEKKRGGGADTSSKLKKDKEGNGEADRGRRRGAGVYLREKSRPEGQKYQKRARNEDVRM